MHRHHLVIAGAVFLVPAVLVAVYWWHSSTGSRTVGPVAELARDGEEPEPSKPMEAPPDAEIGLQSALAKVTTDEERLQVLDDYLQSPDAHSTDSSLRSVMLTGQTGRVRTRAFHVARDLAKREGREALIAVLREGVGNPYPEVAREAIRSCRDNPSYELVPDLIAIVREGGADRSVAIQALAFTDDPEAQQLVLDTAKSEEVARGDRIQAIALLSRTGLEAGVEYLKELAAGDDPELQRFSMEALAIWQERSRK
jgi:HEAT repeat protein